MIHEFVSIDGQRLTVDCARIEAVLERDNHGVQIVTGSDTYNVKHDYDGVVTLWRKAAKEKANARSNRRQ